MTTKDSSAADAFLDAALDLAGQEGWRGLTLRAIAERAGKPLAELPPDVSAPADLLDLYGARLDQAMLAASGDFGPHDPVRDRLFEIVMARFDAMKGEKAAMAAALRDLRWEVSAAAPVLRAMVRFARLALEASGVSAGGWRGALRVRRLSSTFEAVLRVWVFDDEGQSKTMAALDEKIRTMFEGPSGRVLGLRLDPSRRESQTAA